MAAQPSWVVPNGCQDCVFFCPANGQGYYCSHERQYLGGVCICMGKYYLRAAPFRWPPKVAEGAGIEPTFTESKSVVLPLDDPSAA